MNKRTRDRLERYSSVLPASEHAALKAWASTFYDFQLDWLLEPADYAICNKSRQIGLSHTTSGVGVLWGAFHGELTTIISVGQPESDEVLDKAKRHAQVLHGLGSEMARPVKMTATEIRFASGGRILALPSSGGRGFTGNVFLDEFAYQQHASKVWDAAAAVTMLGGRLRVASTPNGVGNDFHGLWKKVTREQLGGWVSHEIPLQLALDQGYPVNMEKCWSLAKGDPRLFGQLFGCKFLDGELQYVPSELIDLCSTDELHTTEGPYYAGLDIGKTVDRTVLTVLRKCPGPLYVLQYMETMRRTDIDGMADMVQRAFQRFDLRRLALDSTGMGAFPAERLQKKHGISKVEPIVFTLQTKEEMATALYQAFAEQRIRIPLTKMPEIKLPNGQTVVTANVAKQAESLREDIASLRRIITTAGNVRYDAPHTDDGHADSAWSIAMALHAAMTAPNYARL